MSNFLNTEHRYGLLNIILHWLSAAAVIALFALGVWMVDLDYYSEWYKRGPDLHRSIGVLLAIAIVARLLLRLLRKPPRALPAKNAWEHAAAKAVHRILLLLVLCVALAGYLISTADGRAVDVFGWFEIPATITFFDNQEEVFGDIHWYLALTLVVLAAVHAAAALQHHFVRKDMTLRRMLGTAPDVPVD
jgi:cytochrome b561